MIVSFPLELVFALITADYTFQNTDPDDNFIPIIETPVTTDTEREKQLLNIFLYDFYV